MGSYKLKKRICIDFDGVIFNNIAPFKKPWVIEGEPVSGALEAVKNYIDNNLVVLVFSARSGNEPGRKALIDWMARNGFPVDEIGFPDKKPAASIYIDDRGFRFEGEFPPVEFIEAFRPWNKKE